MKSEAEINTEKINNAIKVIQCKNHGPDISLDPSHPDQSNHGKTIDLTKYTLENGEVVSTINRLNNNVPQITNHIPTDEEVFDPNTGLPNHIFIRDHFKKEGKLTLSQAIRIIQMATDLLSKEPNLLHVPAPVTICGDIHGQYFDLLKLFEVGGDPSVTPYLFLGDYVDRGSFSFECLLYLYSLKLNFNDHFWLLRGNHECKHLTSYFTFKNEILHKYNITVYDECCKSFNALPLAALMNEQYFCVHGGISPELKNVEDINTKIDRFKEIPPRGLMCDLVWADPIEDYDEDTDVNLQDFFLPNEVRGCSYAFTYNASCDFLQRTGLLSIIRAHEAQDAGYRMYKNTKSLGFPSLLTLFSAPNYLDTYKNKAAILKYENNVMNIRQFNMSPHPYWLPDFMDVFTWSLPFVGEKVTEMLVSILNICTEDELEENTPVIEDQLRQKSGGSTNQNTHETKNNVFDDDNSNNNNNNNTVKNSILGDEHRREALRKKILAIAKVSRMYSVLRDESEKVQYLKDMNHGILPRGALAHGADSLNETLSTFERAKKEDLINEKLPPSLDQVERDNREKYGDILKKTDNRK